MCKRPPVLKKMESRLYSTHTFDDQINKKTGGGGQNPLNNKKSQVVMIHDYM